MCAKLANGCTGHARLGFRRWAESHFGVRKNLMYEKYLSQLRIEKCDAKGSLNAVATCTDTVVMAGWVGTQVSITSDGRTLSWVSYQEVR